MLQVLLRQEASVVLSSQVAPAESMRVHECISERASYIHFTRRTLGVPLLLRRCQLPSPE